MVTVLRDATPDDAASLAALSIEVWLGTYLRQGVNRVFAEFVLSSFTPDNFSEHMKDPSQHIIVSDNQDGIDGYIRIAAGAYAPLPDCADTEITTLYVQPRHHGRGIGRALLNAGLNHARQRLSAPSVWLTTNSQNAPAIAFYLKNGFERIGTTDFVIDGVPYPNDVFRSPV